MKSTLSNVVVEINRLHREAARFAVRSREVLHRALASAWQAGRLLIAEKKSVRRRMGPGAWLLWLEQNFNGTHRTAQRYMKLARLVGDITLLRESSLRQTYARLGIATEPKTPSLTAPLPRLPPHVSLASRLMGELNALGQFPSMTASRRAACRQDLAALYARLRLLFESGPPHGLERG